MKISLLPFSLQLERLTGKMDADTLCRIAKDNGIESLDLMTSEIMLYGARELIRAFDKTGVYCGCVIADLPFYQGSGTFPKKLEKALEKCEKLGAKSLMIVPGSADERACARMSREEMLNRAVEMYSSAVTRAREKGIEVLFEDTPQPHKPLSTAADCRRVLDAVTELGFAFDTANFMVSEENCDILANYDLLCDRIRRVHIKEAVRGKFPSGEKCSNGDRIRCVAVGAGCAEVKALLKKLGACSYDGALCIEYSAGSGVHRDDRNTPLSVYIDTLNELKRAHRIRAFGVSNWTIDRIEEANAYARQAGLE